MILSNISQIEKRYSPYTVESYQLDLEQFAAFLSEQYEDKPQSATTGSLRTWVAHLMEEQYAASSVHRKISTLRAYYRFLQKRGIREDNPENPYLDLKKNKYYQLLLRRVQ